MGLRLQYEVFGVIIPCLAWLETLLVAYETPTPASNSCIQATRRGCASHVLWRLVRLHLRLHNMLLNDMQWIQRPDQYAGISAIACTALSGAQELRRPSPKIVRAIIYPTDDTPGFPKCSIGDDGAGHTLSHSQLYTCSLQRPQLTLCSRLSKSAALFQAKLASGKQLTLRHF